MEHSGGGPACGFLDFIDEHNFLLTQLVDADEEDPALEPFRAFLRECWALENFRAYVCLDRMKKESSAERKREMGRHAADTYFIQQQQQCVVNVSSAAAARVQARYCARVPHDIFSGVRRRLMRKLQEAVGAEVDAQMLVEGKVEARLDELLKGADPITMQVLQCLKTLTDFAEALVQQRYSDADGYGAHIYKEYLAPGASCNLGLPSFMLTLPASRYGGLPEDEIFAECASDLYQNLRSDIMPRYVSSFEARGESPPLPGFGSLARPTTSRPSTSTSPSSSSSSTISLQRLSRSWRGLRSKARSMSSTDEGNHGKRKTPERRLSKSDGMQDVVLENANQRKREKPIRRSNSAIITRTAVRAPGNGADERNAKTNASSSALRSRSKHSTPILSRLSRRSPPASSSNIPAPKSPPRRFRAKNKK